MLRWAGLNRTGTSQIIPFFMFIDLASGSIINQIYRSYYQFKLNEYFLPKRLRIICMCEYYYFMSCNLTAW